LTVLVNVADGYRPVAVPPSQPSGTLKRKTSCDDNVLPQKKIHVEDVVGVDPAEPTTPVAQRDFAAAVAEDAAGNDDAQWVADVFRSYGTRTVRSLDAADDLATADLDQLVPLAADAEETSTPPSPSELDSVCRQRYEASRAVVDSPTTVDWSGTEPTFRPVVLEDIELPPPPVTRTGARAELRNFNSCFAPVASSRASRAARRDIVRQEQKF
jgi:hypothetical protein